MKSIIAENITQYQIKIIKYRYNTINTKGTLISTNGKNLSLTFTLKYRQSTTIQKRKAIKYENLQNRTKF